MNTPSRTDFRDKGEQAGSTAGRKMGETLEKARDTASSLAEKAGEKAEGVYQKAQDLASNAGPGVRDAASQVADQAQHAYDMVSDKASEFNDDVVRLISRHPKQAVMIGFGAGCLIGAVLLGGMFATSRRS